MAPLTDTFTVPVVGVVPGAPLPAGKGVNTPVRLFIIPNVWSPGEAVCAFAATDKRQTTAAANDRMHARIHTPPINASY